MAVAVTLDGQQVLLDPSDRSLAFGHVAAGLEGTTLVMWDKKTPTASTVPETPYRQNASRAAIELAIDASGKATGKGVLTLSGLPAWRRTLWKDDAAQTLEAWKKDLADDMPGFVVRDVEVEEKIEEQSVVVRWNLSQRDEDVLGNELTLSPSHPLGPAKQPFPATPPRKTAVQLEFAQHGELELRLRWPEGWKPQALPQARQFANAAGAFALQATPDADGGGLVYRRTFDRMRRNALTRPQIEETRTLFQQAADGDAQDIVLARR